MTTLVVDASVVFKWFLDEPGSDQARALRNPGFALEAPAILPVEISHGLRRLVVQRALESRFAREIIARLPQLPVDLVPAEDLLGDAFDFALQYERSIYDSLYAVLALRNGCRFVTADRKFYDATVSALPGTMLYIDGITRIEL